MTYTKPEDYTVYRCRQCGELMYSKWRGHFSSCSCGNFVDQTEYYMRRGGNFADFEELGLVKDIIDGSSDSTSSTPASRRKAR